MKRVVEEHLGQCVGVVGHGGAVGASFIAIGELPIREGTTVTRETRNASITEWIWNGMDWRLVRYNDTAHLAALGSGS